MAPDRSRSFATSRCQSAAAKVIVCLSVGAESWTGVHGGCPGGHLPGFHRTAMSPTGVTATPDGPLVAAPPISAQEPLGNP
jgi:hypothetical protein